MKRKTKKKSESYLETRHVVMPLNTNHYGTAFGGFLMSIIDSLAGMSAEKHCEMRVVTKSVNYLNFICPVLEGDHILLKANPIKSGQTSLTLKIEGFIDTPISNKQAKALEGEFVFVGIDNVGTPQIIPELEAN